MRHSCSAGRVRLRQETQRTHRGGISSAFLTWKQLKSGAGGRDKTIVKESGRPPPAIHVPQSVLSRGGAAIYLGIRATTPFRGHVWLRRRELDSERSGRINRPSTKKARILARLRPCVGPVEHDGKGPFVGTRITEVTEKYRCPLIASCGPLPQLKRTSKAGGCGCGKPSQAQVLSVAVSSLSGWYTRCDSLQDP